MIIQAVRITQDKTKENVDYWRQVTPPPAQEELSDARVMPQRAAPAASVPLVAPEAAPAKRKRGRPPLPPELRKRGRPLAMPLETSTLAAETELDAMPIQGLLAALAAVRSPAPEKTAVNMRLDAEVVAWLKRNGGSLSDRINSALRALMNLDLAVAA